ncbi:MAG: hypothetical protein KJ072_27345 [Verrucomicrobia bacterium]|nr:hypothetical protein [Verrucomicrobiota bacterium]
MKTKLVIVAAVVLMIGIGLFWPFRTHLQDGEREAVTTPAGNESRGDSQEDVSGESRHARLVRDINRSRPPGTSVAQEVVEAESDVYSQGLPMGVAVLEGMDVAEARSIINRQWYIAPPDRNPRMVSGPPGKPDLLEGVSKEEVIAAWGPPDRILSPRTVPVQVSEILVGDGDPHLEEYTIREGWHYYDGDDLGAVAWFDGDELSASGTPAMVLKRKRLEAERVNLVTQQEILRIFTYGAGLPDDLPQASPEERRILLQDLLQRAMPDPSE